MLKHRVRSYPLPKKPGNMEYDDVDAVAERAHLMDRLRLFHEEHQRADRDRQHILAARMKETGAEIRNLVRRHGVERLEALLEAGDDHLPAHVVLDAVAVHPDRGLLSATFLDGPRDAQGIIVPIAGLRSAGDPLQACRLLLQKQARELQERHSQRRHTIMETHGRLLGGEIVSEIIAFADTFQKNQT